MKRRMHNRRQRNRDTAAEQEGLEATASRERQGAESAGQSGDLQGLSGVPDADSESVEELIAEGQFYEAEVVSGVENASDDAETPMQTREVPCLAHRETLCRGQVTVRHHPQAGGLMSRAASKAVTFLVWASR
jgi:hypothetical protein